MFKSEPPFAYKGVGFVVCFATQRSRVAGRRVRAQRAGDPAWATSLRHITSETGDTLNPVVSSVPRHAVSCRSYVYNRGEYRVSRGRRPGRRPTLARTVGPDECRAREATAGGAIWRVVAGENG